MNFLAGCADQQGSEKCGVESRLSIRPARFDFRKALTLFYDYDYYSSNETQMPEVRPSMEAAY